MAYTIDLMSNSAVPASTRFGVLLPMFDPLHTGKMPPVVRGARLAEDLGFEAAWVGDHLWGNAPWLDSTVSLGAAAAVTEGLMLAFSVMLLALRPPKQIQSSMHCPVGGSRSALAPGVNTRRSPSRRSRRSSSTGRSTGSNDGAAPQHYRSGGWWPPRTTF